MAAQNERRNGGIINPLFDGLTYNTRGYFASCVKYEHMMSKNLGSIWAERKLTYVIVFDPLVGPRISR